MRFLTQEGDIEKLEFRLVRKLLTVNKGTFPVSIVEFIKSFLHFHIINDGNIHQS